MDGLIRVSVCIIKLISLVLRQTLMSLFMENTFLHKMVQVSDASRRQEEVSEIAESLMSQGFSDCDRVAGDVWDGLYGDVERIPMMESLRDYCKGRGIEV